MKQFEEVRVALWSDQPEEFSVIEQWLSRLGCRTEQIDSTGQLWNLMIGKAPDVIIARLSRSFRSPLRLLSHFQRAGSLPPVLIVVDGHDVDLYLEAMREGAFDSLALPVDEKELLRVLSQALGPGGLKLSA